MYDYLGLTNIDSVLHTHTISDDVNLHDPIDDTSNNFKDINISDKEINHLANEYKRTSWKKPKFNERRKRYWAPHNDNTPSNKINVVIKNRKVNNVTITDFYKIDIIRLRKMYDDSGNNPGLRLCGSHKKHISSFNFVSRDNEAYLYFHSDHSLTGMGFGKYTYSEKNIRVSWIFLL